MLKLDIIVHPTLSEPKIAEPEAKGKDLKKWRFPWRINMLATPKPPIAMKYEPLPSQVFKVFEPVEPAIAFRADHLSRPYLRILYELKRRFKDDKPYEKRVLKILDKSWASIYNYYRKILRDRRLKKEKRRLLKLQAKKPKGKSLTEIEGRRKEHLNKLATPKKLHEPEKEPRQIRALEDLMPLLETLAAPKEYIIEPPRDIGTVNSKALLYEITETVLKLAQLPQRMKRRHSDECVPGAVKPSALRAKCSERVEKLAQPSFSAREAKKHEEDKYDPWIISPNALKYKASPRVLELAKPLERE